MNITPSEMRLVYLVGFSLFAVFLVFHVGTKHRKAVMRRALGSFLLCLLGFTVFALQIPAAQTAVASVQQIQGVSITCFPTDEKQPFPFKLCYTPGKPYDQSSIELVLSKGIPHIQRFTFIDIDEDVMHTRGALFGKNAPVLSNVEQIIPVSVESFIRKSDGTIKKTLRLSVTLTGMNIKKSSLTAVLDFGP